MALINYSGTLLKVLLVFFVFSDGLNRCDGNLDFESVFFGSHLTHKFAENGKFVLVFDELFDAETVQALFRLTANGYQKFPWIYSYVDQYEKNYKKPREDNLQWTSRVDAKRLFMNTTVWTRLKLLASVLSGGKEYFPNKVEYTMTRRFDQNRVCTDSSTSSGDLSAQIFLNKDRLRNDYSETVFYRDDGEILASIYPKEGRLIIWNSSIPVVTKPPSMSYIQAKYRLDVKLTTSWEKSVEEFQEFDKLDEFHKQQASLAFPLTDSLPLPSVNLDEHQTRRFYDSLGRVIAVYDDVVEKTDLDQIRTWLFNYNTRFMSQPYDPDPREDHDNVSWITSVDVSLFLKSRLWRIVHMIAEHLSGSKDWHPYDVSMNIVRTAHSTRIHADCEEHEYEYTFLMYLTPDWDVDNYGETAFFEEIPHSDKQHFVPGDEQYELIGAVRPRYGRIVIFRGIIPHSARPPSPGVDGARLTFACKVSKNARVAYAKMLQETMEYLADGHEEQELVNELVSGQHENPQTSPLTDQNIQDKLRYHSKERENVMKENIQKMINVITA